MANYVEKKIIESGLEFELNKKLLDEYSKNYNFYLVYKFYNDGVIIENGNKRIVMFYTEFKKIVEEKNTIAFYITSRNKLIIPKDALDIYQYSFLDLLITRLEEENKKSGAQYEEYKNSKYFGLALQMLLFMFSVYVIIKGINYTITMYVFSFFMVRLYLLIYNKYIGNLNKKGITFSLILATITVFLGYYIFYVRYYYLNYYSLYGYSYYELLLKLFLLLDKEVIIDYCFGTAFTLGVGIVFNIGFINKIKIDENNIETPISISTTTHYSKKDINYLIPILVTLLLGIGIIIEGPDTSSKKIERNITKGYYNEKALNIRYNNEINDLKLLDNKAYEEAKDIMDNQAIIVNFNANEYYVKNAEEIIKIFADFNCEDYHLFYNITSNHNLFINCEWSEWYGDDDYNNQIDLSISATGNGYAVITITNDYNDNVIKIFIDRIERKNNKQKQNLNPNVAWFENVPHGTF